MIPFTLTAYYRKVSLRSRSQSHTPSNKTEIWPRPELQSPSVTFYTSIMFQAIWGLFVDRQPSVIFCTEAWNPMLGCSTIATTKHKLYGQLVGCKYMLCSYSTSGTQ